MHMREFKSLLAASVLVALVTPAAAAAQALPRLTVLVNGGYQPSTTSFDDSFTFSLYQETGRTEVSYPVDAGPIFEGGAAIRLWRGLAVGGVVSRFAIDNTVSARSFVPHPLFLQRSREVTGEAGGIRREENAVHIQAQYLLPAMGRFRIVLAGGPSVIDIKQAIVTEVKYTQEYPYDTATFAGVDSRRITGTATGFNAGADLQWMFTRNVGAGALVRFTRAIVDLSIDGRTIQVDAGGTQVGAGVRIGF
jgi:hypothetical protein